MKAHRALVTGLACAIALASGCSQQSEEGISPQVAADSIHAVLEADRTAYTQMVVNRLANQENVIKASEHWKDDKSLPLPAQMFRAGSEIVQDKRADFSYSLLSLWPIHKQNAPRTDVEKEGLKFVNENPKQNFYKEEDLGGKDYFTAVYADKAVAEACVSCHNNHPDTPRDDFKLDDVMGGVVIRLPL